MLTPEQRSAQASHAARAGWDKEPDKAGRVARMRSASPASVGYWEPLVDPSGSLAPDVRAEHARIARAAHFRHVGRLGGRPRKALAVTP